MYSGKEYKNETNSFSKIGQNSNRISETYYSKLIARINNHIQKQSNSSIIHFINTNEFEILFC